MLLPLRYLQLRLYLFWIAFIFYPLKLLMLQLRGEKWVCAVFSFTRFNFFCCSQGNALNCRPPIRLIEWSEETQGRRKVLGRKEDRQFHFFVETIFHASVCAWLTVCLSVWWQHFFFVFFICLLLFDFFSFSERQKQQQQQIGVPRMSRCKLATSSLTSFHCTGCTREAKEKREESCFFRLFSPFCRVVPSCRALLHQLIEF